MIKIEDHKDGRLTLSIGDNSETMFTQQLDDFILALARARAEMLPEPEYEPALDKPITTAYSPRFWVGAQPEIAGVQLMVRHFGYNWLSFMFRPEEAKEMIQMLTEHVTSVEQGLG